MTADERLAADMASPATPVRRAGAGMRLLRAAVFAAACVLLAGVGHMLASDRTVPVRSMLLGWLAVMAVVVPLAGRERRMRGIAGLMAVGQVTLHAVFGVGQMCTSYALSTAGGGGGSRDALTAIASRLLCGRRGAPLTPQSAQELLARSGLGGTVPGVSGISGASAASTASGTSGALHALTSMPGMSMPGMSMPGIPLIPSLSGAQGVAAAASASGGTGGGSLPTGSAGSLGFFESLGGSLLGMASPAMLIGHLLAALAAGWLLRRGEAALWRLVSLSARGAAELAALSPAGVRRAAALLAALAASVPRTPVRVRRTSRGPAAPPRTVRLRHSLARRGPPVLAPAV